MTHTHTTLVYFSWPDNFIRFIFYNYREKRIGDGILNCTAFGLPQNCTQKYTSPSAEFWK